MISWMHIVDIGHTAVMVPVAGAIAAWLLSTRQAKLAIYWCALFTAGLGLVALSKIAFLGWGMEIPALGFKALSGHAWRATAVLPVLFFVLLQRAPAPWARGGALLGVALGMGLGSLLIVFEFHTRSEVVASVILGIAASATFIRFASGATPPRPSLWTIPVSLVTFVMIWGAEPSSVTPRLVDVALYLSGRDYPYRWLESRGRQLPPSYAPGGVGENCGPGSID